MPLDDTNWSTQTEVDSTTALLIRARGFIERGWCRGEGAKAANGCVVDPTSAEAVAWCSVGALVAAGMPVTAACVHIWQQPVMRRLGEATAAYVHIWQQPAMRRLGEAMWCASSIVSRFNDNQETVEPILAAFDRAIAAGTGHDTSAPKGHAVGANDV
jgi:hypothetical protein